MNWHKLFNSGTSPAPSEEMRAQSETGSAEAQNNLGVLYASGRTFPPDYLAATLCFRKAAEKGYPLAQANLARMYALGTGQEKDLVQAANWFRRAARQGDAGAQFELGRALHRQSLDNPSAQPNQARIEGFMWLQLASAQGFYNAESACNQLNLQMSSAELEEGKRRVAEFVPKQES